MAPMLNRRSFLIAGGLTALASTRVLGANDTIRIGVIGAGGRMRGLLDSADKAGAYQIVAVSDVYGPRRNEVWERSGGLATAHLDYHEVLEKDIDAVIIASPDHWHVRMAVDALAAGKDVYLEKPVTHTLEEGATLTKAVRSSKQILQCGMQQRSWTHFRDAVEIVQGGTLGRVTQVRTYWWQNYGRHDLSRPTDTEQLDWKRWLGGAPEQAFSEEKFRRWRWFWNFGGGGMTDLFTHWIDVVQWAMKADTPQVNRSGFGVYREGVENAQNPILSAHSFRDGTITHMENFFECVKSRKEPNAPVETGVAAARAGHIGNLAYLHGGQAVWPPKASA
jgi:predicted dehydrogenase